MAAGGVVSSFSNAAEAEDDPAFKITQVKNVWERDPSFSSRCLLWQVVVGGFAAAVVSGSFVAVVVSDSFAAVVVFGSFAAVVVSGRFTAVVVNFWGCC